MISIFAVIYGCKCAVLYYDYVLKKEIDGNHTRRAVKRMNKRVSRVIRITNWKKGQITDARLEELLGIKITILSVGPDREQTIFI